VRRAKILVIDRTSNIRRVVSELLDEEGYDVVTAASTDDGQIRRYEPAVIVVDVESSEDLALIRAISRQQLVAIVPFGCTPLALEAMSCGATDYIVKPLSRQELLLVVATAVEQYNLGRELAALKLEIQRRIELANS
jgi:DNA-binding NtrC family response regulator